MNTPFFGQLMLAPYSHVPEGWARCEGQLLDINTHDYLFSLIGTTYSGHGKSNLALPDLRSMWRISE